MDVSTLILFYIYFLCNLIFCDLDINSFSHGYMPTLQYWIQRKRLNFQEFKDEQGRNLLVLAVSYNSVSVLQYFVKNVSCNM